MEKDTENQARPTLAGEVKQEVKAHLFHNAGFLRIDYFTLFWIFVAGCVFGLVVETVFTVGGLGTQFVTAIGNRDYPVIMAIAILLAALMSLASLISDVACHFIDPKISLE